MNYKMKENKYSAPALDVLKIEQKTPILTSEAQVNVTVTRDNGGYGKDPFFNDSDWE
jgi:hypothetical protein